MKLRVGVLITFLSALTLTVAVAQQPRPLRAGEAVAATFESTATHVYSLTLDASQFVYGAVEQISVDVVVTVSGPDGEEIRAFDSPARGPETFQFETEVAGTFTIEVAPFGGETGDYAVEVLVVEPLATDPEDRVDQMMVAFSGQDTAGGVVGVIQDGQVRFVRAYGMANLEHDIPFRVDTKSNIGSVTKQFTAMGLLLLQAEGLLSLDDDIRTHIPELPDFGTPITLRNLLNHTGGYREVYNLLPITGFGGEDAFRREDVIRIVQRQPDLQAQPNTEFNYNNTGYILAAETIERVSGMTFPGFMKGRVFEPLGMHDTRVKAFQGEIIPGSAAGYVPAEGGGLRTARDLPASYGAGGIYTTFDDLTKWMLNYRDASVGGSETIAAITSEAVLENGESTGYGLGLGITEVEGQPLYTHTGGDVAHRAYFGYYPEVQSGVVLLSNNASFDLSMGTRIARVFFPQHFDAEEADESEETAFEMSPERMEAIAGDWLIEAPGASMQITYSVEDGGMFAQASGQPRFAVTPTSDATFSFVGVDASVTFTVDTDGSVSSGIHHQGADLPMRRIEKVELTAEQLQAYAGRYFSSELEIFFEIRVLEDKLIADQIRMESIELEHRDGDDFSGPAFFANVAFERTGNGAITGFTVSNGRTKGILFRKQ